MENNLRELLRKKGMTATELGEHLNISQQQVSKYVYGFNEPKLENLKRIAHILDCSVYDIYPSLKNLDPIKNEQEEKIPPLEHNNIYNTYNYYGFSAYIANSLPRVDNSHLSCRFVFLCMNFIVFFMLVLIIAHTFIDFIDSNSARYIRYLLVSVYAGFSTLLLAIIFGFVMKVSWLTYLISYMAAYGIIFNFNVLFGFSSYLMEANLFKSFILYVGAVIIGHLYVKWVIIPIKSKAKSL